jgi:flagellar biosynthesis protein FlhB
MSDSSKQYPISETKLKRLRAMGEVPFSYDFQTAAIVLAFFIACAFSASWILHHTRELFQGALEVSGRDAAVNHYTKGFSVLLGLMLRLITPVLLVGLLAGWYQTGFLLNLNVFRFNVGKVFTLWENLVGGLQRRLALAFFATIKLGLWLGLMAVVLSHLYSNDINALSVSSSSVTFRGESASNNIEATDKFGLPGELQASLGQSQGIVVNIYLSALLFTIFVGVTGRLLVVWVYQLDNRMTRTEVEEESRETEVSPEVRQAYLRSREAAEEGESA